MTTETDTRLTSLPILQDRIRRHSVALAAATIGGLTLLIRLALHGQAFDLIGDEVTYVGLGRSVINGGFPAFDGQIFFLHGPGFFYLEAGWERLAGSQDSLLGWVYEMRTLDALLATATAVAIVLLGTRASSLPGGSIGGLLFAMDPFCIRQNDRVLLETSMMFWVLLGYLAFTSLIERPEWRRGWPRALGAGLLFGCGVLTKDEGALLTVLPLLAAAALRWGPRRAFSLVTLGTTVAVYLAYVTVVAINGRFGNLLAAKTVGIQRMLGNIQLTGFHSKGVGGVSGRLIAEAGYFVPTYVILALALPALLLTLFRGNEVARVLGLMYCAAGLALAYALVRGTLEEQELYLLMVPSLIIVPVAGVIMFTARSSRPSRVIIPKTDNRFAVAMAALALLLAVNGFVCVQWIRQPDDGIAQLISYMTVHIPYNTNISDAAIGTNSDIGQQVLQPEYNVKLWVTPIARSQDDIGYVLVPWTEVYDGYSFLGPSQIKRLVSSGRIVFSFRGRTYGDLVLYKLPLPNVTKLYVLSARQART